MCVILYEDYLFQNENDVLWTIIYAHFFVSMLVQSGQHYGKSYEVKLLKHFTSGAFSSVMH